MALVLNLYDCCVSERASDGGASESVCACVSVCVWVRECVVPKFTVYPM